MSKENSIEYGNRIKEIIHALGLNQNQFADSIGFTNVFVSEVINGKRNKPGWSFFKNIAEIYNINLNYIFLGNCEMFVKPRKQSLEQSIRNPKLPYQIQSVNDLKELLDQSNYFALNVMMLASDFLYTHHEEILEKQKKELSYKEKALKYE